MPRYSDEILAWYAELDTQTKDRLAFVSWLVEQGRLGR
jgi:hypothetical protein